MVILQKSMMNIIEIRARSEMAITKHYGCFIAGSNPAAPIK